MDNVETIDSLLGLQSVLQDNLSIHFNCPLKIVAYLKIGMRVQILINYNLVALLTFIV